MEQICYLVFPFQNETSVHRLIDVSVPLLKTWKWHKDAQCLQIMRWMKANLPKKRMQINRPGVHIWVNMALVPTKNICAIFIFCQSNNKSGLFNYITIYYVIKSMRRGAAKPWWPDTEEEKKTKGGIKIR